MGWFRPQSHEPTTSVAAKATFSDHEVAEAKSTICSAFNLVREAITVNTNKQSPTTNDFAAKYAIAANSRLALYGGGEYLLEQLTVEPATPADLADAVKRAAATYREVAITYLSERPEPPQHPLTDSLEEVTTRVDGLCK
ncbi:hypothetical protein [Mycobacterium angelicum]|uniref:hypothetical protein n=1 Tax=Mycobacterium angelicum TaxID=470074 RepID=UPI00111C15FF|nr:hypothetical protein [Mycobacterium angelicum]MCV7200133.1 hypothetical protein [Mycobacterium angelicum]